MLLAIKEFFLNKCEDCGRPIDKKMEIRLPKRDGSIGILCQDCACPRLGHREMLTIIKTYQVKPDPSHSCDITKLKSHTYEKFMLGRRHLPIMGFSSVSNRLFCHIEGETPMAMEASDAFKNRFAAQEAAMWFNIWLNDERTETLMKSKKDIKP